jgi:hypothetical protein
MEPARGRGHFIVDSTLDTWQHEGRRLRVTSNQAQRGHAPLAAMGGLRLPDASKWPGNEAKALAWRSERLGVSDRQICRALRICRAGCGLAAPAFARARRD